MARRLKVIVEADGGARGNPGPAGYGAVVREAATGEVLLERAASIGHATNNVAEYSGLIAGLRAAADLGAVEVEVRMDSKLVVEQMSGRWKISNEALRRLAAQAATVVRQFDTVRFTWVPRAENAAADALANAAMDGRIPDDARPPGDIAPGTGPQVSWAPRADVSEATRLILVRHGATVMTAQGRYSGRGDVPLSSVGRAQARAAAGRVAALVDSVDTVVTSPLLRCRETAETIAAADVPVVVESDLIECDFGDWEGLTFGEVRDGWPREQAAWLADTSVAPPGGESFQQVGTRVRRAVGGLFATYPGRTVVVVSHVTPIKLMLRDALAAGDAFLHRLFLDAAGVSLVDRWPDGGIAVRLVNDTSHLAALGSDPADAQAEPEGGDATDQ